MTKFAGLFLAVLLFSLNGQAFAITCTATKDSLGADPVSLWLPQINDTKIAGEIEKAYFSVSNRGSDYLLMITEGPAYDRGTIVSLPKASPKDFRFSRVEGVEKTFILACTNKDCSGTVQTILPNTPRKDEVSPLLGHGEELTLTKIGEIIFSYSLVTGAGAMQFAEGSTATFFPTSVGFELDVTNSNLVHAKLACEY